VIEQRRDRFAGHRRPPVGVHHRRDALDTEHFGHQIHCQLSRFGVVDVRADDHPRVDVDHHVAVEVLAADWSLQLGVRSVRSAVPVFRPVRFCDHLPNRTCDFHRIRLSTCSRQQGG